MKDQELQPFVKWVGGKRQLLPEITKLINSARKFDSYYEPFLGGGAVFLNLQPENAILNDQNSELINAYQVIQSSPNELISELSRMKNTEDEFYRIRSLDRSEDYQYLSSVKKAARMIYLNKTCFNGLYRVNRSGYFNASFGKYSTPNIVEKEKLIQLSAYFNDKNIHFQNGDFSESLRSANVDSLVYLDPPYLPVSKTANFTGYTSSGFDIREQIRIRNQCHQLHEKGAQFILSNSNNPQIYELYSHFHIKTVFARRSINSNGQDRGSVKEVLITNIRPVSNSTIEVGTNFEQMSLGI